MQLFAWGVEFVRVVVPDASSIDGSNSLDLRERLLSEVSAARHVILDLDAVSRIDGEGLATLLACGREARARGSDLRICGLSDRPKLAFHLLRLETVIPVHEDLDEALRSCGVSVRPAMRHELAMS